MSGVSMNELTTYRWSFEEDVLRYAAAGITALGVWRQKLSDFGEEKGAELLRDAGLSVSNLLWAGGFTGSDGLSYQEGIEDATEAIELAAELETDTLVIYSGAQGGHTHNHARRLLTGALKELVPVARDYGVSLALEPMHESCAEDWTFLKSIDETLQICDAVDDQVVRLVFDTYHLAQDPAVLDQISELAPRTAIVHVGDSKSLTPCEQNRCPLGQGTLPLREVASRFLAAGFSGFFDVELMGEEIEALDYQQLIRDSRVACEDFLQQAVCS